VIGRDWTIEEILVLSLWFRRFQGWLSGFHSNVPEPMYIALTDADGKTGVVYHNNPEVALLNTWTEWRISLQEFHDQGVSLANVSSITIGFGNRNNPVAGGEGEMWFDDIRLYRPTPEPAP
jgi:hypothetical protein